MRRVLTALLMLALWAPWLARAASAPLPAALHFQAGKITLPGGIATLDLPPHLRYLDPEDTRKVLVDGWGNPPGAPTLGMILPTGVDVLGAAGWGVIVSYDAGGHVRDDEAGRIDYAELLAQLKDAVADHNTARREQGYAAMTLIGWAGQPGYDRARRQLHWAKELHTEGSNENGLNYHLRVLGRDGVLAFNAVAGMDQIEQVRREMNDIGALTDFAAGRRYADFDTRTDKLADYGLAALVAGAAATRPGLFARLGALLLGFKPWVLVALLACGAWLYRAAGRQKAAPGLGHPGQLR